MDVLPLERFELQGLLGSGSDYEAHAAIDAETGEPVVVKRPNPDYIARGLHHGVDRLTEQLVDIHASVGASIPHLAHMVGYARAARGEGFFGDSSDEEYLVLVEERARGIPLAADIRDKFKGVPVGLGQNLFALYPMVPHSKGGRHHVIQQLIEVEEAFGQAGHLVLDLRPQNVYFDPRTASITIIDIGTVPTKGPVAQGKASMGEGPKDFHDFFLELFKFYITAEPPPPDLTGYREPMGMRTIPRFEDQIDSMVRGLSSLDDADLRQAILSTLTKIKERSYSGFEDFRADLTAYLILRDARNWALNNQERLVAVWRETMEQLRQPYWRKFLFDPESDLEPYGITMTPHS